jgi:hypothetical protein
MADWIKKGDQILVFRTNDRPLFEFVGGNWPAGQPKEGEE